MFGRKKRSTKTDFPSRKVKPSESLLDVELLRLRLEDIDGDKESEIYKRKAILEDIEFGQLSDETLIRIIDDIKKIGIRPSSDKIAYELRKIWEERIKEHK